MNKCFILTLSTLTLLCGARSPERGKYTIPARFLCAPHADFLPQRNQYAGRRFIAAKQRTRFSLVSECESNLVRTSTFLIKEAIMSLTLSCSCFWASIRSSFLSARSCVRFFQSERNLSSFKCSLFRSKSTLARSASRRWDSKCAISTICAPEAELFTSCSWEDYCLFFIALPAD